MNIEEYFKIDGTYELKDGLYNVTGDVELNKKVEKLPVNFGSVTGDFWCNHNNLTSFEGCPTKVGDNFCCHSNKLTSLKGCPKYIGGDFNCSNNNLKTLKGCPKSIGGHFFCDNNNLTSLKGCPKQVGDGFYCDDNLKNTKEYRQYLIIKKLRD